jgi:carboxypeptidase D
MLQGNGPFIWRPGTYKPIPNPYSWTNLTNMVYVDQPAGTGFSPGPSTARDEADVARQFKTWFKNFVDTFGLHGRKVYITGESYAGQYVPYIASAMLDEHDTAYFNVRGIQIIDPMINTDSVMIYGRQDSCRLYCILAYWFHSTGGCTFQSLPEYFLPEQDVR